MQKQTHLMDFILLAMTGILYCSHFILGSNSFITSVIRIFIIVTATFYAGRLTADEKCSSKDLTKKFLFYGALFLLAGLFSDILRQQKLISQSLSNMLTLVKVPKFSEIFFTIAVLMACSAFLCKYRDGIKKYKFILIALSIIALFTVYIPNDIIGYPIFGVFFGCNTFRCVAVLPALGFYVFGLFCDTFSRKHLKTGFLFSLFISIASGALYVLGFQDIARYTVTAFPLYILFLIETYTENNFTLPDIPKKIHDSVANCCKCYVEIFSKSQKKHLPVYFLTYTVFFSVTAFLAFAVFREYNNTFIWHPDGVAQYYPKAYYFATYMRDLFSQFLSGDFTIPSYDFSLGMGHGVSFSHEPLYYLFALFRPADIETAFNVIFLIRYFFAGISVSVLLLYFGHSFSNTLIGSIMYTFSGFALIAGVRHPHFIVPMILLPLMIIATEEIIRHKRWYLCTPLIAISLLCGYYFHYINTIMIGIYYVARFLFTKKAEIKNISNFIKTTFCFGSTYVLGVIIGNITLTTSFASYLGSSRSGHEHLIPTKSLFFYQASWFKRCLSAFISMPEAPGYVLRLGFVPLAVIGLIILFIKQEKKILKFLFLLLSLFCIFPFAGYVLSGFSTVTNRWSYAYALLITVITVYALPKLTNLSKRELKIIFFSMIPYLLFVCLDRDFRSVTTAISAAILFVIYVIVLLMNNQIQIISRQQGKLAILMLCIVSVTVNSYYQYLEGAETSRKYYFTNGESNHLVTDTPIQALDTIEDDSFYRVGTPITDGFNTSNASYILDFNGITEFSSTINGHIMDYNHLMGNGTFTVIRLKGFDNRTFMNSLACVKYYSVNTNSGKVIPYGYEKIKTENRDGIEYDIYENKQALPLGYTYESAITESELLNYNTLSRQEAMMQSVVVDDDSEVSLPKNKITDSVKELEITGIETEGMEIVDESTVLMTQPVAKVTLYFDSIPDTETYLEFDGDLIASNNLRGTSVYLTTSFNNNMNTYQFPAVNHTYNTHQETYLYNMGYQKDSVGSCTLTITSSDIDVNETVPHTFSFDSFRLLSQSMTDYDKYINRLSEDVLENITVGKNTVSGDISLDQDKMLVLSIPYEKGWTAYVDGEKSSLEKVNIMYSGLSLSAGEHHIELIYETPGRTVSYAITAAGIMIYILAVAIYKLRQKKTK